MENFRAAAIISEYNPFHMGHQYHIEQTRRICGADFVVAVMSGDFVQRGEPALLDKWARTEMALRCGADMVVELPVPYALSSAQYFASGGVDIISKMSIITHLSFGSESFGDENGIARLEKFAARTPHGPEIDKDYLRRGHSYVAAAARKSAVQSPNDVLGAEYIRALHRLGCPVRPVAVKRAGSEHNLSGSAMHIRNLMKTGNPIEGSLMPALSAEILQREIKQGKGPVLPENLTQACLASLRSLSAAGIRNCPYVGEGLEYKIYSAACECTDLESLVRTCTSLRYTASRIRRIVFSALLGLTREMAGSPAPYIRILGIKRSCGLLMDALTAQARVPVITSKAKFLKQAAASPEYAQAELFLQAENRAADIYVLGYPDASARRGYSEMTHPLIYV